MFLIGVTAGVIIVALNGWLLNRVNKRIWNLKSLKWISYILPILIVLFILAWIAGTFLDIWWIRLIGASGTAFTFVLNLMLIIALPFSLGINKLHNIFSPKKENAKNEIDNSRRLFLKTAASVLPAAALVSTGRGFAASFSQTRFPQIVMEYPDLPAALDGFKILHLTDLHLGYYFGLDHLQNTLLGAEKYHPDMIAVTGDIADDLKLMTDAMRLIDQFKTPQAKFASLGNHEYFRGIKKSIREIEKGPVPLLINQTSMIDVNGIKLLVGGADDPVRLRGDKNKFFEQVLSTTFENAAQGDFRLLLSHRPNALDSAEKYNIDLTLSGHTHGGQVGLDGRSFWDIFSENAYLWGPYQKGNSKLYTSAGMGHWFPFRLNCPLEAPIITLKRTT